MTDVTFVVRLRYDEELSPTEVVDLYASLMAQLNDSAERPDPAEIVDSISVNGVAFDWKAAS